MKRTTQYQQIIRQLLTAYAKPEMGAANAEIECQPIFDTELGLHPTYKHPLTGYGVA